MKYIMTVVFESEVEEKALLAFQNSACLLNQADGVKPLQIAHIKAVLNGDTERPTLQTLQVLNPEDFSTWNQGLAEPPLES